MCPALLCRCLGRVQSLRYENGSQTGFGTTGSDPPPSHGPSPMERMCRICRATVSRPHPASRPPGADRAGGTRLGHGRLTGLKGMIMWFVPGSEGSFGSNPRSYIYRIYSLTPPFNHPTNPMEHLGTARESNSGSNCFRSWPVSVHDAWQKC